MITSKKQLDQFLLELEVHDTFKLLEGKAIILVPLDEGLFRTIVPEDMYGMREVEYTSPAGSKVVLENNGTLTHGYL